MTMRMPDFDGEIVLHKAYRLADRKRKLPNRLDTVFSFGSIARRTDWAAGEDDVTGRLKVDRRMREGPTESSSEPRIGGRAIIWRNCVNQIV